MRFWTKGKESQLGTVAFVPSGRDGLAVKVEDRDCLPQVEGIAIKVTLGGNTKHIVLEVMYYVARLGSRG